MVTKKISQIQLKKQSQPRIFDNIEEPKIEEEELKIAMPIDNKIYITSPFGVRTHPIFGSARMHNGIEGTEKEFHIHTKSDKVMNGNKADFTLNFKKGDKGGVFLNSYDATLTTKKGEERTHSFPVNRSNNITAKEAINLLEG
uniref:hypothetical protein n=1 Tax=Ornithobacterium rhinotracheale TaxID=28251 RepID=UPI0039A49BE9